MSEEVLWDIPAPLKEYHVIEFDHEKNGYHMFGHILADNVSRPQYMFMPADMRIITRHESHNIVELRNRHAWITIYSQGTHVSISQDLDE